MGSLSLPPGFRFHPTDEELLIHYLCRKVAGHNFPLQIITDIDLYKYEPWILPSKATFGEKEWYFFSPRERKYPNGSRPNRVAGSGYWKATGTDKIITTEGRNVGIKKSLVFYVGKAPKGSKSNWIMHEYRLFGSSKNNGSSRLDEWVLCRLYKKNSSNQKQFTSNSNEEQSYGSCSTSSSRFDDVLESFPELDDRFFALPRMNSLKSLQDEKLKYQDVGTGKLQWDDQYVMGSVPEFASNGQAQHLHFPSVTPFRHVESRSDKFGSSIEYESESGGLGVQQVNNSGLFQYNSNVLTQSSDSAVPLGNRYNTQDGAGNFRFVQ